MSAEDEDSFPSPDEPETWDAASDVERSAFSFLLALNADVQISLLKSLVKVRVESFSGKVIIFWDLFLFND